MKHDVFIAYKAEEVEIARALSVVLNQHGFKVWYAANLLVGQEYEEEIFSVIDNTSAAIVLWSSLSVNSQWVKAEVRYANAQKKLLPTTIDDTKPPPLYRSVQTLDLRDWIETRDVKYLQPLLLALAHRTNKEVSTSTIPAELAQIRLDEGIEEAELWKNITSNTRASASEYAYYLELYGDEGTWAELAKIRKKSISNRRRIKLPARVSQFIIILAALGGIITTAFLLIDRFYDDTGEPPAIIDEPTDKIGLTNGYRENNSDGTSDVETNATGSDDTLTEGDENYEDSGLDETKSTEPNIETGKDNIDTTSIETKQPIRFCSNEVIIPAKYATEYQDVITQESTTELVAIPATFETVTETIITIPSHYKGASFATEEHDLIVQEASTEFVIVPPVYETYTKQIRFPISGQQKAYSFRVIKTPARVAERVIPAVTTTVTQYTIVENGAQSNHVVPATVRYLTRRIVKAPPAVVERIVPNRTETLTNRYIVTPSKSTSVEEVCDLDEHPELKTSVIKVLTVAELIDTSKGGATGNNLALALGRYQIRKGLVSSGTVTKGTLDKMNISYK